MHSYLEASCCYDPRNDPCVNFRLCGLIVHFECRLLFSVQFAKVVNYDLAQVFSVSLSLRAGSLVRIKDYRQSYEQGPLLCI